MPHVVILGAGFGGLACAQALGSRPVRVTVIDRQNYHLFVPLLYQVASAALSPSDIAEPVRKILRRHVNIKVLLAEIVGIDAARQRVVLGDGEVPYDELVIATGSSYNYFGNDDWARFAPALKTVANAQAIRSRVLLGFEKAETTVDPEAQRRLTTTVVVGGGPTGVEMAGSIAELARWSLAGDFRHINPRSAKVLLVEAGPRILGPFPERLAAYAQKRLERLGVTVITGQSVEDVRADGVVIDGEFIPAHTVVWGAGVKASPAAEWLGITADKAGRVPVGPDLRAKGFDNIYALGDTALLKGEDGEPLPGLAQVAKQQGQHLGRELAAYLERGKSLTPFRFRNRGNTAVIGRSSAIFHFDNGRQMRGWFAWILWAIVHVYLLVGFQNRLLVSTQWFWRWLTYERGARLITTEDRQGDGAPP